MRRILAASAVIAALAGAAVYGGLRLADGNDGAPAARPSTSPALVQPPAPYDTLTPSQYHFGAPIARAAHGDVIAYAPRHGAEHLLTIPFTITNHASEPASYQVTVTVTRTAGEGAGTSETAFLSSEGPLPPGTTMATEASFGLGAFPSRDLDVRIARVEKDARDN